MKQTYIHTPRLIFIGEKERGKIFLLGNNTSNSISVGRDLKNDIIINNESVSSYHCSIEKINNNVYTIADANSTNGTFVNKQRIGTEPHELVSGDIIGFSDTEAIYLNEDFSNHIKDHKTDLNFDGNSDNTARIKNSSPFYKNNNNEKTKIILSSILAFFSILSIFSIIYLISYLLNL